VNDGKQIFNSKRYIVVTLSSALLSTLQPKKLNQNRHCPYIKMSTPTAPADVNAQNDSSRPQKTSSKANERILKNTISYTSKLRSSDAMSNNTDTERIRLRLASGGTAADLAEEGYRVCRMNASLRRELDEAKRELHAPLPTDNDTARIQNRLDNGDTAKEIAEEAYRVCRINAHLRKSANSMKADMREMKKKMAVKDDALSELRSEYPEVRKVLQRTWRLLENENVNVPTDLRKACDALTMLDGYDWQTRKGSRRHVRLTKEHQAKSKKGKGNLEPQKKKGQDKGKGKGEAKKDGEGRNKTQEQDKAKEVEKKAEPDLPSLFCDSHASIAEPDPPVSKKRKGGDMEGRVAKRAKIIINAIEDDEELEGSEEGEILE
jgi:hypothetical protein